MSHAFFETERLRAEEFETTHIPALTAIFMDASTAPAIGYRPQSEELITAAIKHYQTERLQDPRRWFRLALIDKIDSALSGFVSVIQRSDDALPEIGFIIAPDKKNQGFATASARGLTTLAFARMASDTVMAECYAENIASVKALEHAGFTCVGQSQKDFKNGRPPLETRIYHATRDGWRRQYG